MPEHEIGILNQPHNVHAHLLDELRRLGSDEERLELLPGQEAVAVDVEAQGLDHVHHLRPHHLHRQCLVLHGGHRRHDLHKDANQHVHDGECRQQHKCDHQQAQSDVLAAHRLDHVGHVRQRAVQEERHHGAGHGPEVAAPDLRAIRELPEEDREDVDRHEQQDQREEDRLRGEPEALQQDEQLRHPAQEPGHARHARHPGHAEQLEQRRI
mmetsp:Transcript_6978/g.20577  ORF Transcript_6978/g.20577 Transcript_6978/m.20577 type:complete len:211 (+) Transcript_6978:173-805(+)